MKNDLILSSNIYDAMEEYKELKLNEYKFLMFEFAEWLVENKEKYTKKLTTEELFDIYKGNKKIIK